MNRRKEIFLAVVALIVLLCLPGAALAQCAMCRTALIDSLEGRGMAGGFNQGILFLLGAPFLVVGAVAFLIFRARYTASPGSSRSCKGERVGQTVTRRCVLAATVRTARVSKRGEKQTRFLHEIIRIRFAATRSGGGNKSDESSSFPADRLRSRFREGVGRGPTSQKTSPKNRFNVFTGRQFFGHLLTWLMQLMH
ncbi:MAG: hypothetical protein HY644_10320 [Acidobacteria bacterium]|nr:hypothetical protein [Acidobacteriota bacterium]